MHNHSLEDLLKDKDPTFLLNTEKSSDSERVLWLALNNYKIKPEIKRYYSGQASLNDILDVLFYEAKIKVATSNETDDVNFVFDLFKKDLDEKSEIQTEENLAAPKVVLLSNSSNNQQNDNKEGTSDFVIQYQKIIEAALDKQAEIKLSDIVVMIKEMTGKKVQNSNVESVTKEMKGIEIFKIGQAKAIRRTTGLLFN